MTERIFRWNRFGERFSLQCRGPLNKTKASGVLFYRRRKVGLIGSSPLSLQSASEKQERRFLRQGEEKKALSRAERTAFANGAGPLREDDGEVDENLT